jgi:outer membrane protein assembly factor BamB
MKNVRITGLVLLFGLISNIGFGQQSQSYPKEINSIKMTAPGIVIVGTDDALYGMDKDGKELWKNERLKKVDAAKIMVLEGSELIMVQGGLRTGKVIVNVYNGNIHAGGSDIKEARIVHGTNQLWVLTRLHGIHVWDIATNVEQYTLDKVNIPYGVDGEYNFTGAQPITYTGESSAILHVGVGQLGEYNLTTGAPIWEFDWKPYKVKKPKDGKGDLPSSPGKGFAIMKLDNESNTLYFPFRNMLIAIDSKTGAPKWDVKANKFQKVNDIHVTKDGIVVKTPQGIELVDPKTGMKKWDKPIKIKGSDGGLLINNKGTFYVVSKGSIEKIDIANRKSVTLTDKIKFKGGESFSSLELVNNVVVLSSKQNMIGIDKESGAIKYQIFLKAPGPSLLDVAGNMVLAGVAMTATMNSMNVNSQAGNKTYHQYTPAMRNSGGSKTTDARKSLYISTKFNDADAKGFGVAKVDKETGEILKKVVIGTRDPEYVIEERNGLIFYKSDKKTLTIKSIN